jgi:hypothetical protein
MLRANALSPRMYVHNDERRVLYRKEKMLAFHHPSINELTSVDEASSIGTSAIAASAIVVW